MAAPIQFRDMLRGPFGGRTSQDRRLEFGVGYLGGNDIGIDALVIAPGASVMRLLYTPGLSSFTGFLATTGQCQLTVDVCDPFTQTPIVPVGQIADDSTTKFNFGTGGRFNAWTNTSDLIWLMWQLTLTSVDPFAITTTLELLANSRESV